MKLLFMMIMMTLMIDDSIQRLPAFLFSNMRYILLDSSYSFYTINDDSMMSDGNRKMRDGDSDKEKVS